MPTPSIPFQLSKSGFKYLGVFITRSIRTLKERNFTALTEKIKTDLQKWGHLPLSLAGRVQIIKMNVLPRYLYIFQCVPIFLPRSFFKTVDSIISTFIWAGKNPRTCRTLLQRSRSLGGLGLPNFQCYYWAANMHRLLMWFTSPQSSWCQLETASCISSSPQALACSTLPTTLSQYTGNPIVVATLKIWAQIGQHFKWSTLPRSTPICNNHLFLPAIIDPRFVTLLKGAYDTWRTCMWMGLSLVSISCVPHLG